MRLTLSISKTINYQIKRNYNVEKLKRVIRQTPVSTPQTLKNNTQDIFDHLLKLSVTYQDTEIADEIISKMNQLKQKPTEKTYIYLMLKSLLDNNVQESLNILEKAKNRYNTYRDISLEPIYLEFTRELLSQNEIDTDLIKMLLKDMIKYKNFPKFEILILLCEFRINSLQKDWPKVDEIWMRLQKILFVVPLDTKFYYIALKTYLDMLLNDRTYKFATDVFNNVIVENFYVTSTVQNMLTKYMFDKKFLEGLQIASMFVDIGNPLIIRKDIAEKLFYNHLQNNVLSTKKILELITYITKYINPAILDHNFIANILTRNKGVTEASNYLQLVEKEYSINPKKHSILVNEIQTIKRSNTSKNSEILTPTFYTILFRIMRYDPTISKKNIFYLIKKLESGEGTYNTQSMDSLFELLINIRAYLSIVSLFRLHYCTNETLFENHSIKRASSKVLSITMIAATKLKLKNLVKEIFKYSIENLQEYEKHIQKSNNTQEISNTKISFFPTMNNGWGIPTNIIVIGMYKFLSFRKGLKLMKSLNPSLKLNHSNSTYHVIISNALRAKLYNIAYEWVKKLFNDKQVYPSKRTLRLLTRYKKNFENIEELEGLVKGSRFSKENFLEKFIVSIHVK